MMINKALILGLVTLIPGYARMPLLSRASIGRTGGTDSARYCYGVWLRHLIMAHRNGLSTQPETVAELGPGDSLGIGLAALLSGANRYYGLDRVPYADNERNLVIFDQLVDLFSRRASIPDASEFPAIKPFLDSYDFPSYLLTARRLSDALQKERVASIRTLLARLGKGPHSQSHLGYFAPWDDNAISQSESVDMMFSQAVMEHVQDVEQTYRRLFRWLRRGGFMSHQIDFKSHGYASEWNGHWAYSAISWRLIQGTRPYLLNRLPHSAHEKMLSKVGFKVAADVTLHTTSRLKFQQLSQPFRSSLTEQDLVTSSAFMQSVKA